MSVFCAASRMLLSVASLCWFCYLRAQISPVALFSGAGYCGSQAWLLACCDSLATNRIMKEIFLSTGFIRKGGLLLSSINLFSSSEDSPTPKLHIFWSCLKSLTCFKIHSSNILLVLSN